MYWNSDEHSASEDNDGFDKETLKEANHTYNFGSGCFWLDFKVGKSGAVSIAETLDCLKKSLNMQNLAVALLYTNCVKHYSYKTTS